MEHSLEAYLERLPTAKLECILQEIRRGFSAERYAYLIPLLEAALKKRKFPQK